MTSSPPPRSPSEQLSGLALFLEACRGRLGREGVVDEESSVAPYLMNCSGLQRRIPAVVRPASTNQVAAVTRLAQRHGVRLYPISTGKNWGLGSRLPVVDDCVVLDLGRMNRIRTIDARMGYVIVEPGVTQRQLYDYIEKKGLDLCFDLTGSASKTSLLGNTVDSGVGYRGMRVDQITGMEVVLPSGELLETGLGHLSYAKAAYLSRHGVGPAIEGLFVQSNLGIVTALGIQLYPRRESFALALFRIDRDEDLGRLIDGLRGLKADGILEALPKVGNRERSRTTVCPRLFEKLQAGSRTASRDEVEAIFDANFGPWSAAVGIDGTAAQVRAVRTAIRKRMRGIARVAFLTERKLAVARRACSVLGRFESFRHYLALIESVYPLFNLARGVPTDATMPSLYWPLQNPPSDSTWPDLDNVGMLAYCPLIPADGDHARLVASTTERIFGQYGFEANITMTLLDSRVMWGVIDLAFAKSDPKQTMRAHNAIEQLHADLAACGIYPQRAGVQAMHHVIREGDSYWDFIARIKNTLDPGGVLSPGRYCPER